MNNLQEYGQRLIEFLPDIIESIGETGIMMSFAMLAAIILGLPIGTILFLTNEDNPREISWSTKSYTLSIIALKISGYAR